MRIAAAEGHWKLFQDTRVFPVLLKDIQDGEFDPHRLQNLMNSLTEMCLKDRNLFPQFAVLADDKNPEIRKRLLACVWSIRPQGVSVLIRGLRDENVSVRTLAVHGLKSVPGDAAGAVPALEAMLKVERDLELRQAIQITLAQIDARFTWPPK